MRARALALFALIGCPLAAQFPEHFPDLRPEEATALLAPHVFCGEAGFHVTKITSYEQDQRVVTIQLEASSLESARAFLEWSFGDVSAWNGVPPFPGNWAFVSFLDARERGGNGASPVTRRSADAMKEIAGALREFQVDFNAFPTGDITTIGKGVFLYYLGERLDPMDAWGHPYFYRCSREHYVLASAGADGVLQLPPEEIGTLLKDGASGRLPIVIAGAPDDLVICDGVFLRGLDAAPIVASTGPVTTLRCNR